LVLPDWTQQLKNYYACLRLEKRNKSLKSKYYRKIQKEKLRLAELGINQEKIRLSCRFLSSFDCVRNANCDSCYKMISIINEPDYQLNLQLISI
jgi:hypothetical protein